MTETLDHWKSNIRETLSAVIDGRIESSACGGYNIARSFDGITLSHSAARLILERLSAPADGELVEVVARKLAETCHDPWWKSFPGLGLTVEPPIYRKMAAAILPLILERAAQECGTPTRDGIIIPKGKHAE